MVNSNNDKTWDCSFWPQPIGLGVFPTQRHCVIIYFVKQDEPPAVVVMKSTTVCAGRAVADQ